MDKVYVKQITIRTDLIIKITDITDLIEQLKLIEYDNR